MELNYKKMVEDVDNIVESDFCFDMDCKLMPNSKKYTQREAKAMAEIIGRIYLIAHCVTCTACQKKYMTEVVPN